LPYTLYPTLVQSNCTKTKLQQFEDIDGKNIDT